ncbi:MAG: malto-oligosyltrehalose synthase [Oligoflexia bacterium]|nr:malto-oligosyltrehalose synthase [Oligoflexia bacterium]
MHTLPTATYRLQFNSKFSFESAQKIIDYLSLLGISHIYASPYFQAAAGSTHGYDILNHNKISEELGGESKYQDFCFHLKKNGLGQILDIVPNHMSIDAEQNVWWWDILKKGQSSKYASYFDINWSATSTSKNKIVIPLLSDHYGKLLRSKKIQLKQKANKIIISCEQLEFPISTESFIALYTSEDLKQKSIEQIISEINFDPIILHTFLQQQHYRLSFWRTSSHLFCYRRFFDINNLIALRQENDLVFQQTHQFIAKLLGEHIIDGLRVDHIDGLRDPEQYLHHLRKLATDAWIIVEKILLPQEQLPKSWPIDGTTGYDFLNSCLNIFIDPLSEQAFDEIYKDFTGEKEKYSFILYKKKKDIIDSNFRGEINYLSELLLNICEQEHYYYDYTSLEYYQALREIIACVPVYRTYIRPFHHTHHSTIEINRSIITASINASIKEASLLNLNIDSGPFIFIKKILLQSSHTNLSAEFVSRFQQITGTIMAKGAEDTAFYCYNRFPAVNEVGGDPGRFGLTINDFHSFLSQIQKNYPCTMLTTSTHDTKRGEDTRMRLAVLSENPTGWREAIYRWNQHNHCKKKQENNLPDHNTEYLLYYTLFAAWPIEEERLQEYMLKSVREAKIYTSWKNPNEHYENILRQFISSLVHDQYFMNDIYHFVEEHLYTARVNSLSQTLIKLTAPGIPDIYQGCELWDLGLVDPDNRKAVDYKLRYKLLEESLHLWPEEVLLQMDIGVPKIWLINKILTFRKCHPEILAPSAEYTALQVEGKKKDHVFAFMRARKAISIIPLLAFKKNKETKENKETNYWEDTFIKCPEGKWENLFTKEMLSSKSTENIFMEKLFSKFPIAFLFSVI